MIFSSILRKMESFGFPDNFTYCDRILTISIRLFAPPTAKKATRFNVDIFQIYNFIIIKYVYFYLYCRIILVIFGKSHPFHRHSIEITILHFKLCIPSKWKIFGLQIIIFFIYVLSFFEMIYSMTLFRMTSHILFFVCWQRYIFR